MNAAESGSSPNCPPTHEEIKKAVIAILEWYGIRAWPEQPTGGGFRVDVVGRSPIGASGTADWMVWGIEVELTSELQKDLASLESLRGLRYALVISDDPRTLSLKTLTIGGRSVKIFPPPQSSTAFEDFVRLETNSTSGERYPVSRLELLRTLIEVDGETTVGELEAELRRQGIDLEKAEEVLYRSYTGENVYVDRHISQGKYGITYQNVSRDRTIAFLQAVGLLSSWGRWVGTPMSSGSVSSEKTYYFGLTESGGSVGHFYTERRIGSKLDEIRTILSRHPVPFGQLVLIGTGGRLVFWNWSESLPDPSRGLVSLGTIENPERYVASQSPYDPEHQLDIRPEEMAWLRSLVTYSDLRARVRSLFDEFEKAGLAVRGLRITSRGGALEHLSIPSEIFTRYDLFGDWRAQVDVDALKRFQAAALMAFIEPPTRSEPISREDFHLQIQRAGLASSDLVSLLDELEKEGAVSKLIGSGRSPYAVYDREKLARSCDRVMARAASRAVGIDVRPASSHSGLA